MGAKRAQSAGHCQKSTRASLGSKKKIHAPLRPAHPTIVRGKRAGTAKRVFELAEEIVEPNRVGNAFDGGRLHSRPRTFAAKALTHS